MTEHIWDFIEITQKKKVKSRMYEKKFQRLMEEENKRKVRGERKRERERRSGWRDKKMR